MKKYILWPIACLLLVISFKTPLTAQPIGTITEYDLDDLIALCFQRNLDIKATYEKTAANLAKVKKAKAQHLPGASLTGVYSHIGVIPRIEMPGFEDIDFITSDMLNFTLGVDYTLFDWGLTSDGVRVEELGLDSQKLSTILLKKALVLQLSILYYNILQVEENTLVLQENIQILKDIIELLKKQFTAGLIPQHPVLQTQVTLHTLEGQQLELEKMKIEMSNTVKNICCLPSDAPLNLKTLLTKAKPNQNLNNALVKKDILSFQDNRSGLPGLLAEAVQQREDFQILRLQLRILEKTKTIISKTRLPLVAASLNAELRNNIMPDVNRLKTNWNAGVTVIYNIFDRHQAKFDKKALDHELQGIRWKIEKQEKDLHTNVSTLFANLEMLEKKISLEQEQLKISKKSLDLTRESFKESQATYLEVLEARSSYNLAESSLVSLKYRKIINLLQIEFELFPLEYFLKE